MNRADIIVYNFYYLESLGTYLPSSYISEVKDNGHLGYMQARAVPETVLTYVDISKDAVARELLQIIQELSIEHLEVKFAKKGRKKFSLSQLYEDEKIGHVMKQYIGRKMARYIDLVVTHDLPLCLEIERKVPLETIRIKIKEELLQPSLSFIKTQTGIRYELQLKKKDKLIVPQQYDVHIIQDQPAWVVIDYQLYQISDINGNKLKPFLKNPSIFIPERITKSYFQKFIMDVVGKVDVEANGFEVIQSSDIKKVSLRIIEDFMSDGQLLDLVFDYGETVFQGSENGQRRTRLLMDEDGEVTIRQVIRSDKEEYYNTILRKLGLEYTPAKRWKTTDEGRNALFHWINENMSTIQQAEIDTEAVTWKGKPLKLGKPAIKIHTEGNQDWFDVKGVINVGEYQMHFIDLLDHIKEDNPYFLLPDGSYFIIPETWMEKYSGLARFREDRGDHVRILKSNYMLLDEEKEETGLQEYVIHDQDFDYQPSPRLKAELRPYQTEGVKWLITHQKNNLGACLADDMGLGKTLQTLAVLNYTKDQLKRTSTEESIKGQLSLFAAKRVEELNPLRALIVLPASLVFNWYEEIKKFSPHFHICQYIGSGRKQYVRELDKFDIVLTTYHTALRDIKKLESVEWEYIVLDESQMIKNRESKIFQAINTLETNHKISLSGTPIENSLADLWSQMQFINPEMLGTFKFFKENFLIPIQRHQDEAAMDLLKSMVSPFILRRRKEEVAADLPELTRMTEYVSMSKEQADVFEREKSRARNFLLGMEEHMSQFRIHVFNSLMRLRQIANHPVLFDKDYKGSSGKFDDVIQRLDTILRSDHKVLIFSSFKSHLALFEAYLKEENTAYSVLTGSSTQKQRQAAVKSFQNDADTQIFLISIKAGGTGLNLTAADYVFILDPWWNPFVEEQAIARAHRIGQDHPVTVVRFISKNSIEEKIIKLQARKKVLSAELIESDEQLTFTREELSELLQ